MKKRVTSLFLFIFCIAFGTWEKIDIVDEFGDKTGQVTMVKNVDLFQGFRLLKNNDDFVVMDVMIGPQAQVGEVYPLKLKIDGGQVIEIEAVAVSDRLLRLLVDEEFFNSLKKGNKIAIVAYNTNGAPMNIISDLMGFSKAYETIKQTPNMNDNEKIKIGEEEFIVYYPSGRVKTYVNDYLGDNEYADEPIDFIPLRALLKEIEEMVNENIKAKTQDHIWQLGEGLIPHLKGLSYSKNLSEEERNELNSLTAETNELAERYQNAFN